MSYRYTLPAQRSPYNGRQRELSLRSQTISNAIARSPGLKRTSLYAHASSSSKDASLCQQSWFKHFDKENIKINADPASSKYAFEEDKCQYDPADPTTWGIKPLPPLPHGNSESIKVPSIISTSDDDATLMQSPVMPPCEDSTAAPSNLAQLIGDRLRIDDEDTHRRTTSSSYHRPESEPSGVQSPVKNGHENMLSVTYLAKYGKTNDRLSNLRSGSPSSATGDIILQDDSNPQDDSSSVVNG